MTEGSPFGLMLIAMLRAVASTSLALSGSGSFRRDADSTLLHYREFGYHIETALVPPSLCDEALACALSLPNAHGGDFQPIPMPHRAHSTFLKMMRFSPIVEIVEHLLGGRASGIGGEYFYMRPGTQGFAPHQDNFYVQAPPDSFISVWTALCDVDARNGGLILFPGTHKLGALEVRQRACIADPGQNPGAQAIESIFPSSYRPLDIELSRGSVVFFHSHLVHGSNRNRTTDRFRHSLLATYIRAGSVFRAGKLQKRTEVDLHAVEAVPA